MRIVEDVAAEDPDVVAAPSNEVATQGGGPARVLLERDDIDVASRERVRQRAATGADFDDVVAGGEGRVRDQLVGEVRP